MPKTTANHTADALFTQFTKIFLKDTLTAQTL